MHYERYKNYKNAKGKQVEDGEVEENKTPATIPETINETITETTFDCVMNAMTGALNMSANNATTGVFSTGESISSIGVVNSETITSLLQEQIRVRKVYELLNADVRRNVDPGTPLQGTSKAVPRSAEPRLESGKFYGDGALPFSNEIGSDSEGAVGPVGSANLFLGDQQPAVAFPVTGSVYQAQDFPPGSFGTPVASSADLAALGQGQVEGSEETGMDIIDNEGSEKSNKRTRSEAEAEVEAEAEAEVEAEAEAVPGVSATPAATAPASAIRRNPPRKARNKTGGSRSGTRRKKKVHRKPHSSRKITTNTKNKKNGSRKSKREKERKNKKTHRRR